MQRRGAGEVRVPTRPRGSPCRVRRRAGLLWWAAVVLMGSGAVAIAPAGAAQANDDFTDAIELAGGSGGVNGSTIDATGEPDEPAPESAEPLTSVWYRWTAPRDGTVVFDTCGSGYDTFLAGYTGSAVDDLTVVAANDDACDLQSRISFPVASGEVYRIQVDGWSAAAGDFLLTWLLPGRDCSGTACTETFGYLEPGEGQSAVQELSVPEDVCAVSVEAVGARGSGWSAGEGGTVDGGDGGSAVGTVEVSPGDLLEIRVGGPGAGHRGGFNGGGDGSSGRSGGGGGASDVRLGGSDPGDRVIVAGGGGGASSDVGGGDGGGVTGAAGADFDEASGGGGGEQVQGGRGGVGVDGLGGEPGDRDGDGGDGAGAGGGDEDEGGGPAGGGGGGGWRGPGRRPPRRLHRWGRRLQWPLRGWRRVGVRSPRRAVRRRRRRRPPARPYQLRHRRRHLHPGSPAGDDRGASDHGAATAAPDLDDRAATAATAASAAASDLDGAAHDIHVHLRRPRPASSAGSGALRRLTHSAGRRPRRRGRRRP